MYLLEVRKVFIGLKTYYKLKFQRCYGCPFYRVESNVTMCLTDRHIWCSSNDYDVDGVIKEATYYKNSILYIRKYCGP